MAYKIIWTRTAIKNYRRIIDYLVDDWTEKVVDDFEAIVSDKLHTLSNQPFIGQVSEKQPEIKSILLTKHNRLYYRIRSNSLRLLKIIDTRRNPRKNPY